MKLNMNSGSMCILLFFIMINSCFACSDEENTSKKDENREDMPHPCLLLLEGEEEKIKKNIEKSPELAEVNRKVLAQANESLQSPPSQYKLSGKRLLDVSRQVLQNLYSLSYAYRMNGNQLYLDRAIAELNAVCAFPNWNPSHYLDVGEMTMAVAIAYDWLYNDLPDETKQAVEKSIIQKAFNTALDSQYSGFYSNPGNWNQVCNAGLVFGALAIYDKSPEKAQAIIDKCYETIPVALDIYRPDGSYPEGFMYWGYGTGFQAMLNYALEVAEKSTFGYDDELIKSAGYYLHLVGPTGKSYNYYDGMDTAELDPTMFYFAAKKKDATLLYWEIEHIKNGITSHRLLPSILVYSKDLNITNIPVPEQNTWTGAGTTPVYLSRSAWDDTNAAFFGVKGGTPSTSHGHMDNGSFVYEVNGIRWAIDLGNEKYETIENEGIDLWNMTQSSPRWNLLRYSNKYHNTITINDKSHIVNGAVKIISTIDEKDKRGAILDMSPSFSDIEKAIREIGLSENLSLEINDKITTGSNAVELQWTMVTQATPQVLSSNSIQLTQNGKKIELIIEAPVSVTAKTWSCQPTTSYETENRNAVCVGFTTRLPANQETELKIKLIPGS